MTNRNGFTLVELAIALMVIGLLIGGVLKGQELIENAKVTSFIRQIKAYDAATMIFRNTYGALPGDIKRPNRIPNCTADACIVSGNGDGKTREENALTPRFVEVANFFPHLTKAGMIQGPEGGTTSEIINPKADPDAEEHDLFYPSTTLDRYLVMMYETNGLAHYNNGHYYILVGSADQNNNIPVSKFITIEDKIDDGKPFMGSVGVIEWGTCPLTGDLADHTLTEYDAEQGTNHEECDFIIRTGF